MIAALLASALLSTTPAEEIDRKATTHVLRDFERVGRAAPRRDAALSEAAERVAKQVLALGSQYASDPMALSEAVSDAGAWEPHPRWFVVRGRPREEALASILSRTDLNEEPSSHYGLAVHGEGDSAAVALVFTQRRAELRPFPRSFERVPAGGLLCGTLDKELRSAEVYVTRPSGAVDKVALARSSGREFCARLRFDHRGRHTVEVLARGAKGPEVAALFFVDAGEQPRRGIYVRAPEATTRDEARAAIVARVNALRLAHGAGEVKASDALNAIAQAYSERMSRENFLAHVAPDGSDVKARMAQGKYAYRLVGENLGLASGPLSAHFGIEHSPGHRKNLLEPGYTEIGVGVAFQERNGRKQAIVTEVLAAPHVESSDPVGDAYRNVASRRSALKLPPLVRARELERLANDHAARALALNQPEVKLPGSELDARVFDALEDVSRTSVDMFVADDPAQLPASRNLDDGRNELIGIGTARGDSPTYGKNRYWVVVIYAARDR